MTLKQRKLIKNLKEAKTLREAGRLAGYTDKGCNVYRKNIKKHIAEVLKIDRDEVLRRFNEAYQLAIQTNDLTNLLRCNEALARINAMFLDRTKEEGTPEKIIISYNKPNVNGQSKGSNTEENKQNT